LPIKESRPNRKNLWSEKESLARRTKPSKKTQNAGIMQIGKQGEDVCRKRRELKRGRGKWEKTKVLTHYSKESKRSYIRGTEGHHATHRTLYPWLWKRKHKETIICKIKKEGKSIKARDPKKGDKKDVISKVGPGQKRQAGNQ